VAERPHGADRQWAAGHAARLLAEARAEALIEARARLRGELVDALLEAAGDEAASADSRREPRRTRPRRGDVATGDAPAEGDEPRAGGAKLERRPSRAPEDRAARRVSDPEPDELPRARRAPEPAASGTELGQWVYGIVPGDVDDPQGWVGVDGEHPVELVRHAEVAALVSAVPLDEFGEEALREGLEDLPRLERLARAHERVLDDALGHVDAVIPFRLCTIYADSAHVRDMLDQERAAFTDSLVRLSGTAEWGVKAFLHPDAAAGDDAAGAGAATGTAYLTRKREAREAAETARDEIDSTVDEIHARLSEQAADAALGRAQDRRLSGRDGEMVLNAAYLIPDERVEGFRSLVEELRRRHASDGIEVELTGPWPPYHFVAVEAGG
jgi:hypothetical protein